MDYIESIQSLLDGHSTSGNAITFGLYDIVKETRNSGSCHRDIDLMYNAYFKSEEFEPNWRVEIKRFAEAFDMTCFIDSSTITFRNKPKP